MLRFEERDRVLKAIIVRSGDSGEGAELERPMQFRSLNETELLGRTVLAQMIENIKHGGGEPVSVNAIDSHIADSPAPASLPMWAAVSAEISSARQADVDALLICLAGAYAEFDTAELIRFHRDQDKAVTRVWDTTSSLDLWVVDPRQMPPTEKIEAFIEACDPAVFVTHGYVNRLETLRDVRRLVVDGLTSQCRFRPLGLELKPGIWVAPGAEVERSARIVAPAYVGRGARVCEDCLVTRCSNLESYSEIDYGTAIEDSSILANTYVGIGLDVSHSVAQGNELYNLQHEVKLRISDSAVMRQGKTKAGKESQFPGDFPPAGVELALSKGSSVQ